MTNSEKLRRIGAWFSVRAILLGAGIVMAKLAWIALMALRFA